MRRPLKWSQSDLAWSTDKCRLRQCLLLLFYCIFNSSITFVLFTIHYLDREIVTCLQSPIVRQLPSEWWCAIRKLRGWQSGDAGWFTRNGRVGLPTGLAEDFRLFYRWDRSVGLSIKLRVCRPTFCQTALVVSLFATNPDQSSCCFYRYVSVQLE